MVEGTGSASSSCIPKAFKEEMLIRHGNLTLSSVSLISVWSTVGKITQKHLKSATVHPLPTKQLHEYLWGWDLAFVFVKKLP